MTQIFSRPNTEPLAWITFAVGVVITFSAWRGLDADVTADAGQEFAFQATETQSAIANRMREYEQALRSGTALFAASASVERGEWKIFVDTLKVSENFPGIQGMGWSVFVKPEELAAHQAAIRAEGFPDYKIRPEGPREIYSSIIYLEPFAERNLRAFGYDMFSEPVRNAAMMRARDSGKPMLSGKVTLVQETNVEPQAGFLMYVPVYRNGAKIDDVPSRRAAIQGFVHSPFRMNDLMEGILGAFGKSIALRIYDGGKIDPSALMYDSHRKSPPDTLGRLFKNSETIEVAGRYWTLEYRSTLSFEDKIDRTKPMLALSSGLLISFLLAAVVWSLSRSRSRAIVLANRMTRDLRASETKLRTIFDNIVDGIVIIDAKGSVQYATPSAERIFGRSIEEMIGRNVNILMPEPYKSQHDSYLANYLGTGEAKIIGIGREVSGQRKDGSTFPMELAVSRIDVAGETLFIGIVRDITERKRVERMKNEFISTVSHELRTPLTSIRGSLGLVGGGAAGELPPKAKALIEIANKNCVRLVALVNDILDIEKIEAGRMEFKFEPIDVLELVRHAVEANQAYGEQYGVAFRIRAGMPDVKVRADAGRMQQVLGNLLSNAAKFSPKGGVVEITVALVGDRVRVSVIDSGPGISEEFRSRIFQKFAQADSTDTRAKGGTGLGLAISRIIVEHHAGHLNFHSEPGKGTTFYFELPVEPARPIENPERDGRRRVLVCEDDADVARLLCLMIEGEGMAAEIASTAAEAKTKLAGGNFAAMTLDLMLPDEGGLSLMEWIKADERFQRLPIIVVSAIAEDGHAKMNGRALGIVDWIQKPIDQSRLNMALRRSVGASSDHRWRILHVEDDADLSAIVSAIVGDGADVDGVATLADARQCLLDGRYDLVILDIGLPDGSGLTLAEEIGAMENPPQVLIFSASEAPREISGRLAAALVKSRTSNQDLKNAIHELLARAKS